MTNHPNRNRAQRVVDILEECAHRYQDSQIRCTYLDAAAIVRNIFSLAPPGLPVMNVQEAAERVVRAWSTTPNPALQLPKVDLILALIELERALNR